MLEVLSKKTLKTDKEFEYIFFKLSLDDRRRNQVKYIASIDVDVPNPEKLLKRLHNNNVMLTNATQYRFPEPGNVKMTYRPVVIGTGPGGLFAHCILPEPDTDRLFLSAAWMLTGEWSI